MKKRILFIGHLPPPVHGVAVINEWICNSRVINDRFDIHFINLSFSDKVSSLRKFNAGKIFKLPATLFKIIGARFSFCPDLIIYNNSPKGIGFWRDWVFSIVIKFVKQSRTTLLFYSHGKGYAEHSRNSMAYRMAANSMFRNTEFVSLSRKLSEECDSFPIRKVHVLNNGIPDNSGPYANATKKVSFLFLSSFFVTKGILDFIEALHLLKQKRPGAEFTFALVGYDFDVTETDLRKLLNEKGLTDHLLTLGPKLNEAKFEIISQSGVLVHPTHDDAFPLVILEAFSFGLPVISTQVGGISEMIDDGTNGFCFASGDIQKTCESMTHFLDHPDDILAFGQQARKKFLEKYRFDVFEQNFIACIESILVRSRH